MANLKVKVNKEPDFFSIWHVIKILDWRSKFFPSVDTYYRYAWRAHNSHVKEVRRTHFRFLNTAKKKKEEAKHTQ